MVSLLGAFVGGSVGLFTMLLANCIRLQPMLRGILYTP